MMKQSDIIDDESIKTISIDNIDTAYEKINIIGEVKEPKIRNALKVVFTVIVTLAICFAVLAGTFIAINMKIVQGDISGSVLRLGGYSMIENSYSPDNYIREGSVVYYDGSSNNFFNISSSFSVGKVVSETNSRVYLQGDKDNKVISINKSQVQFVVDK